MTLHHLDLADFLLVAEDTLQIEAGYLATMCDLGRADAALNVTSAEWAGEPLHAGLAEKGAALLSRLVTMPPVPARATEVALACLFELAGRNGYLWVDRAGDAQALSERIRSVTPTGSSDVSALAHWIADHLEPA